jgi:hypothetical protein
MDTAGFESQTLVLAVRLNGDVTCAPFAGVWTVMASAGVEAAASAKIKQKKFFMDWPRKIICAAML